MTARRGRRVAIAALAMIATTVCSDGPTSPSDVASVHISASDSNPRVGDAIRVSASAFDKTGAPVQTVICTFSSDQVAVASVDPTTGAVSTLAVGAAVITANCGGRTNAITITVRPPIVTLTLNQAGTGTGAVSTTPPGGTFDRGVTVSLAALAATGSTFTGWSGACTGTTSPCSLLMDASKTVTATFTSDASTAQLVWDHGSWDGAKWQ